MSIIRVQKRPNGYVQIDRRSLDDDRLSFEARGLHAYLLARPDSWIVRVKHLSKTSDSSEYKIRKILRELVEYGYAELIRKRADDGTLRGSEWRIYEAPEARPDDDPGDDQHRDCEIPDSGDCREPANSPPLVNTELLASNENNNNDDVDDFSNEQKRAVDALVEREITDDVARRLVTDYPLDRINEKIGGFDADDDLGTGWLIRAIENDWAVSKTAAPVHERDYSREQVKRFIRAGLGYDKDDFDKSLKTNKLGEHLYRFWDPSIARPPRMVLEYKRDELIESGVPESQFGDPDKNGWGLYTPLPRKPKHKLAKIAA